ncbi:MAG: small multi-drug export protein [Eubacteriales bacterium]|nr:small multi-drug export protein [Eubacteriales bacterium]
MAKELLLEYITVLFWSMVPIVELRGAIPIGTMALDLPMWSTYIVAVIGNLIPVPFIIKFIRPIFEYLESKPAFKNLVAHYIDKANRNAQKVRNYKMWGLFIFVALPLPGTGAWTGALVAAIMDMRIKDSFLPIALGVATAGLIMIILSAFGINIMQ